MNQHLKTMAAAAANWLPDALMTAGAAAVAYGVWLVYPPAGIVVGGLFALGAGVILSRSAQ